MALLVVASIAVFSIILAITISYALKLVDRLWIRPKKIEKCLRELGFAGNPYMFFFGDLKELSRMTVAATSTPMNFSDDIGPRVLPYHHHIIKKHGNKSFIWFGAKPRLNITDPMLVKEILSRPEEFHKVYPDPIADLAIGGLPTARGDKWQRHRKIAQQAFTLDKLKMKIPVIHLSCENMINNWKTLVSKATGTIELDVCPYMVTLARDVISRAAFGSNFEEGRRIFQLHEKQDALAFQYIRASYTPWSRRYFEIKANRKIKESKKEMTYELRRIVEKREKTMKMGQEFNKDGDLLSILLESTHEEMKEQGRKMSMEEVIDECKTFYVTGSDSIACLLVWTMILLSKHIDWQARAREEVLQVVGNNNKLDFENVHHLNIVTMILYEVFRLYPGAPMLLRATSKKTKLGNMTIPPWVHLTMPLVFHNQDPEIWGNDAKEFNPQRFSEGISNATKGPSALIPFSWGPRTCIGHQFAMIEVKMAIAIILQHFSFELSPSYIHAPELYFLLRPQYGAKIILKQL